MDVLSPLAAVVVVLALLGGALLLLKRRGAAVFHLPRRAGSGPRRMEVLERVALGPHHALHLVRIADRHIVVGTSPASCHLLDEAPGVKPL
ncbi:MAG: flagellar biosynthetic protein FliO [Acidobacteriota bacterium]